MNAMQDSQDRGDEARLREGVPLGHIIASHNIHGWCSHCPGRSVAYEVEAWRVWAHHMLLAAEEESGEASR